MPKIFLKHLSTNIKNNNKFKIEKKCVINIYTHISFTKVNITGHFSIYKK